MTLVRRPARSSVPFAVLPGAFAALSLATSAAPFALALAGLAVLAGGTAAASRRFVTLGGLAMFGATVLAGLAGVSADLLLLATAGTVVAWTTGHHVVGLGRQLGRDAPAARSVVAHLAGATVATLVAGGVGLAVFRLAEGAVVRTALAFLLLGIAALVVVLGN